MALLQYSQAQRCSRSPAVLRRPPKSASAQVGPLMTVRIIADGRIETEGWSLVDEDVNLGVEIADEVVDLVSGDPGHANDVTPPVAGG